MDVLKAYAKRLIEEGFLNQLIIIAAINGYPLTAEEVSECLGDSDRKPRSKCAGVRLLDKLDKEFLMETITTFRPKLTASALAALVKGLADYGLAEEAVKVANLHPDPVPLYDFLARRVAECDDAIEDVFPVLSLGVSTEAYETYLGVCFESGRVDLAIKTAELRQRTITKDEFEIMVKANIKLCEFDDAAKAAEGAGRKLTQQELKDLISNFRIAGDLEQAGKAAMLRGHPFTRQELSEFLKSLEELRQI
jgi:hypothetical protein